jgi:choline dehydrogenase-like flavoprotein
MSESIAPDIVIIGTGMGGATAAYALAPTGARILILEKGHQLADIPQNRDARAIFQQGYFRPKEHWYDAKGTPFSPGNYYNHGGNSKFYGGVLLRYRAEDFEGISHADGDTPPWPIRYQDLEPWYDEAERLYQVRGALGEDPTEPHHNGPYPYPAVPDEPAIAQVRARLAKAGLHPFSLPLGVDIERWLGHAKTPWDAFPDSRAGKMDAETCALIPALRHPNVSIESGAEVKRLIEQGGATQRISAKLVILAAGAVRSAVILLASGELGLANRSDAVGRHFMNHNASALLAIDPRFRNDSVYQKTFGVNDFYLSDGRGGPPLGNVQLLGRVSAAILKANLRQVPEWALHQASKRAVDFYAISEDLPDPNSRVRVDGPRIVLDWQRTNMTAHKGLVRRFRESLRAAGFPIVLSRMFDRKTPSDQCGTIRLGDDPAKGPLNPFGRAFDHPNLFVVDASTLVSSAAVNPSLNIAALSLRTAEYIKREMLGANGTVRSSDPTVVRFSKGMHHV